MKKLILIFILTLVLVGCESEPRVRYMTTCETIKEKVVNVHYMGKSIDGESAGIGAMAGSEVGLIGCFAGGPIGCAVGAGIGALGGAALGSLDDEMDYQLTTEDGKTWFCEGDDCEDIAGNTSTFDGTETLSYQGTCKTIAY